MNRQGLSRLAHQGVLCWGSCCDLPHLLRAPPLYSEFHFCSLFKWPSLGTMAICFIFNFNSYPSHPLSPRLAPVRALPGPHDMPPLCCEGGAPPPTAPELLTWFKFDLFDHDQEFNLKYKIKVSKKVARRRASSVLAIGGPRRRVLAPSCLNTE